jgi:hypothetical protein
MVLCSSISFPNDLSKIASTSASLLIPQFHPLSHSDSALACSHCDFHFYTKHRWLHRSNSRMNYISIAQTWKMNFFSSHLFFFFPPICLTMIINFPLRKSNIICHESYNYLIQLNIFLSSISI